MWCLLLSVHRRIYCDMVHVYHVTIYLIISFHYLSMGWFSKSYTSGSVHRTLFGGNSACKRQSVNMAATFRWPMLVHIAIIPVAFLLVLPFALRNAKLLKFRAVEGCYLHLACYKARPRNKSHQFHTLPVTYKHITKMGALIRLGVIGSELSQVPKTLHFWLSLSCSNVILSDSPSVDMYAAVFYTSLNGSLNCYVSCLTMLTKRYWNR